MKVILLGLEFFINNLGCEAMSYSFAKELYDITIEQNKQLELVTIVFADQKIPYIPTTKQPIKCIKIAYKSRKFWEKLNNEFKSSDLIVDFTMGDSFSDIYGKKRFFLNAMVKTRAIKSGIPYILGPQTYGPFYDPLVKSWAGWIVKKALKVYARDEKSQQTAAAMSKREVILTTDIAFALPYHKNMIGQEGKIKVGFNPSGLLWNDCIAENNQFKLLIDYKEYCLKVCEALNKNRIYEVFLIPHVGTADDQDSGLENDLQVCYLLQKKYPDMKIIKGFHTPMDVKNYMAAMDIVIGARMHATIGAFSSGVATIPVSYSRKFEGLYESLCYPYVIHSLNITTEEAVHKTLEYISHYQQLQLEVTKSLQLVKQKQESFRESLLEVIKSIKD